MKCIIEACECEAVACNECRRALTMKWWGAVARHPEAGTDCQVCEQGRADYCGNHLVSEIVSHRASLRAGGRADFGEPRWLTGGA